MDCSRYLESEQYMDILLRRSERGNPEFAGFHDYCVTPIDEQWEILHVSIAEAGEIGYGQYGYTSFPLLYSVQDYGAMNASGIIQVRDQPFLALRGSGTLVGIVDTGIRYTHEAFIREDGTSTIEAIWDQTATAGGQEESTAGGENGQGRENAQGTETAEVPVYRTEARLNADPAIEALAPFGKVYRQSRINEALAAGKSGGNPLEIVPVTDVADGHGTFMAGLAAGRENREQNFTGAAPDAGLVVVKLKQAKRYLKDFYLVNDNALCYSETDIIFAIRFLDEYARLVQKPIAIIVALGTNLSSHIGSTVLSDYMNNLGRDLGRAVVTCTGNYSNCRLHFKGNPMPEMDYTPVEIRVGTGEKGFICSMWSRPPEVFSLEFVSPTGRVEKRVPPRVNEEVTLRFPLDGTRIQVYYGINQSISGLNFAIMRFINPSPGIWTIRTYGETVLAGGFNMWLSNKEFLWGDTYFLQSNPYETITDPGNSSIPITVGAYDYRDGSIYIGSGRGETAEGGIKPDIVAPGVGVIGPVSNRDDSYGVRNGTSPAAAITGGGAALLLEYGIVQGYYPYLRTYTVKNYMISGAVRREGFRYPDPLYGYGFLNIYGAIESFRK